MKTIFLLLIRFYRRFISPFKPPSCRFYPTCSSYAMTAISKYGALRGGFLAFKRILKCHPYHPGGIDYVPQLDQLEAGHVPRSQCSCKKNSNYTHYLCKLSSKK